MKSTPRNDGHPPPMRWVPYKHGEQFEGQPPPPRSGHITVLASGSSPKLVVYGGLIGRKFLGDVSVLDFKEGKWFHPDCGEGPSPRAFHSAVALDGNIFMFGGRSGKKRMGDLWMLDTENWRWWELPCGGDPPSPRDFGALCSIGSSRLVLHGGWDGTKFLSDTYVLDTLTLEWRAINAGGTLLLPAARCGHSAAVVEKRLIVFGGRGMGGGMLGDLWALKGLFDDERGGEEKTSWTVLRLPGTAPSPRCGQSLTSGGTQLLFFGGHGQEGWITRSDVYLNDCVMLDRTTVQWRQLSVSGELPAKRAYHTMTAVGKRFLLIGGFDGKTTFEDLWWLCPEDDEWARRDAERTGGEKQAEVAPGSALGPSPGRALGVGEALEPQAAGAEAMAQLRKKVGLGPDEEEEGNKRGGMSISGMQSPSSSGGRGREGAGSAGAGPESSLTSIGQQALVRSAASSAFAPIASAASNVTAEDAGRVLLSTSTLSSLKISDLSVLFSDYKCQVSVHNWRMIASSASNSQSLSAPSHKFFHLQSVNELRLSDLVLLQTEYRQLLLSNDLIIAGG